MIKFDFKGFSTNGFERVNEDSIFYHIISDNCAVAIVADGIGGLDNGKIAAEIVVQTVYDTIIAFIDSVKPNELLRLCLLNADSSICKKSYELKCKMGAAVAVLLIIDNQTFYSWQGNARIYMVHDNIVDQWTEDHCVTTSGYVYLTRCINGKGFKTKIPIEAKTIQDGDKILLCTDGYYKSVLKSELFCLENERREFEDDSSYVHIEYTEM